MSTVKRQLMPVPFTRVQFNDTFWAPRMETNRKVTLRHIYQMLQETGRIGAFDLNFERAVPSPIVQIFGDSDPAKWLEAVSYALATQPDAELEALADGVIDKVVSAQQPDGYLNTHFIHTLTPPPLMLIRVLKKQCHHIMAKFLVIPVVYIP